MGCWNATCNVSNLPIYAGDNIVVIPLMQVHNESETNVCYATDNFVPFGLPIFGEYDDYGGIEKINTHKLNEKLLHSFSYYTRSSGSSIHEKIQIEKYNDDFERFINDVICVCDTYVETVDTVFTSSEKRKVSFFMVHRGVYDLLVKEVGARKPYGFEQSLAELLTNRFDEKLTKYIATEKESAELIIKLKNENVEMEKINSLHEMFSENSLKNLADDLFTFGEHLCPCTNGWKYFIRECLVNDVDDIVLPAVEKALFTQGLSMLRKGYHCESGMGSQSCETRLHYILSEYIINHIKEFATKRNQESVEEYFIPSNGLEETIFF